MLAGATAFLDLYATQPLLPLLARTFHASTFKVSLTVTASTVGVALAAPAVGRLADAIGLKRVMVGAVMALAGTTAMAATSGDLDQLIFWRFAQGLATPGVFAVTLAYIHDQWPASRVGTATAAYVTGTVVGGFAGRVIAGVMAADVNWRAAFIALAALNLVAGLALWRWLPRERRGAQHPPHHSHPGALWSHLRNRQLVTTCAVGFGVLFTLTAVFTYITFVLAAPPYSLSTASLGSLFVVYLFGAAITPTAGRWLDLYGHRRLLTIAVAMGALGGLLTLAAPLSVIIAGLALSASGVFVSQLAATGYVGTAATHDRGLAVGIYSTCYYAGGSCGAAVPAIVWHAWGWPGCVALVLAVQIVTLMIAYAFWTPRQAVPATTAVS